MDWLKGKCTGPPKKILETTWFVVECLVGGLEHVFIFPYIGNNHNNHNNHPNCYSLHGFSEGRYLFTNL